MLIPVIMAGGSGTRLWPMSRKYLPKQFLRLTSNKSTILQETLLRLNGLEIGRPIVVAGDDHRFLVAEQLREIDIEADILLEPEGKNTAPAIALAATWSLTRGQIFSSDPSLLILAADHVIQDVQAFQQAVKKAGQIASSGKLVTFGIVPTEPNTGYGYIRKGEPGELNSEFSVDSFVEKPDIKTAEAYLSSGDYLWSSGMFLFKAESFVQELERLAHGIANPCAQAVKNAKTDLDFVRVDAESFKQSEADSIDYAVMEKTDKASVIPLDAGWSDVGSWSSLWEISEKDSDGNHSNCDTILEQTKNTMVMGELTGEHNRLITTLGVEDLVIVDTKDALLVAHKDAIQDVKKIVKAIGDKEGQHDEFHRVVYRPWGHYDSIDSGERFQVKRITVKPGEKLSVQMHHHRAEHWVVVSGTAKVQ